MRKLILLGALALPLTAGGTGSAQAAPWCAWYDAYTYNCGFYTQQQCLETVRGAGGFCWRNVYEPTPPREPRRRYHRSY